MNRFLHAFEKCRQVGPSTLVGVGRFQHDPTSSSSGESSKLLNFAPYTYTELKYIYMDRSMHMYIPPGSLGRPCTKVPTRKFTEVETEAKGKRPHNNWMLARCIFGQPKYSSQSFCSSRSARPDALCIKGSRMESPKQGTTRIEWEYNRNIPGSSYSYLMLGAACLGFPFYSLYTWFRA